ncbi:hypothetical protein HS125_04845 [bacterium]|nr:hypothetical protein [bacterium]
MGGKRSHLVYWLLLIVWVLIDVWQVIEHDRVRESAKAALRGRARDISNTVGMVIRSRRQVVDRERIEEALRELMESDVLISVALLNRAGEVLASAGEPVDDVLRHLPEGGERWERDRYVNFNPVDLGAAVDPQDATEATPILFDDNEPPDEMRRPRAPWPPGVTIEQTSSELIIRRQLPPGWPAPATGVWDGTGERPGGWRPPPPDVAFSTAERRPPRAGFGGPPRWGRPRWISEQQWASMLNQRGHCAASSSSCPIANEARNAPVTSAALRRLRHRPGRRGEPGAPGAASSAPASSNCVSSAPARPTPACAK